MVLVGCSSETMNSKPTIVVTNHVLLAIISEITGPMGNIVCLLKPSDSPHTYSAKPSDAVAAKSANIFFYTASNLDGWASSLESANKIELIKLIPKEFLMNFDNSSGIDPHFWTDPMLIKAILPIIVEQLSKVDKNNASLYKSNSETFAKRLDLLDVQINDILKEVKGKSVFLFHPSFRYFLKRYSLIYGGAIEEIPGKEPTANTIASLIKKIQASNTKSIFTEPQLNEEAANALVFEAKLATYVLDPIGGDKGRKSYADLLLYNANILRVALK